MSKLRVCSFSVSLDGYGAGAAQSLDHPLGLGGEDLHTWALATRTFRRMCCSTHPRNPLTSRRCPRCGW